LYVKKKIFIYISGYFVLLSCFLLFSSVQLLSLKHEILSLSIPPNSINYIHYLSYLNMWFHILSCLIFLILNVSLAISNNARLNNFYFKNQCNTLGDQCQENNDCCPKLTCYSIESMLFSIIFRNIKYSVFEKIR
jgi:hypothetical protein